MILPISKCFYVFTSSSMRGKPSLYYILILVKVCIICKKKLKLIVAMRVDITRYISFSTKIESLSLHLMGSARSPSFVKISLCH